MSVSTSILFLNSKDSGYIAAKTGTPEERYEWEQNYGPISDRPGKDLEVYDHQSVTETDDEYGGWVIDLSKIPKNATHIVVYRG